MVPGVATSPSPMPCIHLARRGQPHDQRPPLDPAIAALPNVTEQTGSAFAVDPRHNQADWLFSDVICYPRRMHTFNSRWLELGDCQRFVITIKLQGGTGLEAIRAFQALGGQVVHLWHNKHEVTFIKHPELAAPEVIAWPWLNDKSRAPLNPSPPSC